MASLVSDKSRSSKRPALSDCASVSKKKKNNPNEEDDSNPNEEDDSNPNEEDDSNMDFIESLCRKNEALYVTCPYCGVKSYNDLRTCLPCKKKYPEGTFIYLRTAEDEEINVTGLTKENFPCSTYHPLSNLIIPSQLSSNTQKPTGKDCIPMAEKPVKKSCVDMRKGVEKYLEQCRNPPLPLWADSPKKLREMTVNMERLLKTIGKGKIDPSADLPLPPNLKEACLNIHSLEKLLPMQWLNDHIINFYCLYLSKETYFHKHDSFIIYSTFFYKSVERFCTEDKTSSSKELLKPKPKKSPTFARPRGKAQSIFTKNFVIIPLNWEEMHWITLVICHPNLIKHHIFPTKEVTNEPGSSKSATTTHKYTQISTRLNLVKRGRTPCMLILDSLQSQRDIIFDNMRRFLQEEYKRLNNIEVDFSEMPGHYVDCPQQKNGIDCGVFTLNNIEKFLANAELFPGYPPDLRFWYRHELVKYKRGELMELCCSLVQSAKELM